MYPRRDAGVGAAMARIAGAELFVVDVVPLHPSRLEAGARWHAWTVLPVAIGPGLWRWTAPHPDWTPGAPDGGEEDWQQMVGCVLYDTGDAVALIDPLLPRDGRERFLAWLDRHAADRPVSILTTIRWHRRDREELARRYSGASARAWNAVRAGVAPHPLRGAGETLFWLPGAAALVTGDRLLGGPHGTLRVCPQSWLSRVRVDRAGLAELLRPLLELPIERLVVSHGEPVLHDGRGALERAIEEARGGAEHPRRER